MPYIGQSPATGEANSFKTLDNITSYTLTFDGSSASTVSVANDTITERNHRFVTGQRVTYNDGGGTAITGLSDGVYYIIVEDKHTIKLATNANNAAAGTAINLTGLGVGSSHTLNVAFDGVNTKFKATVNNGTRADITSAPQLMLSINGVLQQPHNNTTSPTTGYAVDHTSTIIFSAAPAANDQFFASLVASNFATFDISDNIVDNFTGDGSTTDFTLSKAPPNNESVLVTIDGVVQYPDDTGAVRAYTVSENILTFASAPGSAVEIQVRHIGFAGASTGGISGFYGRTGNAVLKNTDNIVFNNATASGTVQAANVTVTGDLTVNGTTTTLDTVLTEVDKLEIDANNTTVAVAVTQSGSGDAAIFMGGNFGIGTNNPAYALDVKQTDTTNPLTIAAKGGTDGGGYFWESNSGTTYGAVGYGKLITANSGSTNSAITTWGSQDLLLGTYRTERVRITSGGIVQVGASHSTGTYGWDPTFKVAVEQGGGDSSAIHFGESVNGSANPSINFLRRDGGALWSAYAGQISYELNKFQFKTAPNVAPGSHSYTTRMTILQDGKVGIGTDNPREKLDVSAGRIILDQDYQFTWASGTTNRARIYGDSGNNFIVENGSSNTERLRIASNGNTGIGTANPSARLEVAYNDDGDGFVINNINRGGKFRFATSGTNAENLDVQRYDSANSTFRRYLLFGPDHFSVYTGSTTSSTERLRISSTGQIGMGKAGQVTPNGNSPLTIQESDSNSETICLRATNSGGNGSQPGIVMKTAAGGHIGGIYCDVNSDYMRLSTSGTDRIYISNAGDVGIGYATPSQKLVVKGTTSFMATNSTNVWMAYTYTDNTFRLNYNGAGSDEVTVTSGGNIGINKSNPTQKLFVGGNIAIQESGNLYFDATSGFSPRLTNSVSVNDLSIFTNNTEKVRITSAGNVGINDTAPSQKLNVGGNIMLEGDDQFMYLSNVGTGNAGIYVRGNSQSGTNSNHFLRSHSTGMFTWEVTGSEKMRLTSDGRLCINATSPVQVGGQTPYLYVNSYTNLDGLRIRGLDTGNTIWKDGGDMSLTVASNHVINLKTQSATRLSITGDGRVSVNNASPTSWAKFAVKDSGVDISGGTADTSSNTRGLQLWQDQNDNKSIGLWFTTGGHLSGISGQRSDYSNHWGTDLRFYTHSPNTSNVTQAYERLRITDGGNFMIAGNSLNYLKNQYQGALSVTGTNNESFAFEIQGSSHASGGLLFVYGTSGNVVVNASAEILVNHSNDVTIKSMSGAYTQLRIRVKTDANARAAIYLGRSAGYGSGTTSLNWRFIPYGGTYLYTTESTNNGTDHTHTTQSGSFRISAAGGGAGNVNASGSKNFMIDHPLVGLSTTTRLAHAAVEGPECNTMYRGKVDLVDGTASVNIDTNSRMTEGTFEALNQNVQCFTTNETGWTAIKGSVSGNLLTITAQDNTCTDTISWMVVGERHDKDIIDNRSTDSEGRFIPEVTDEYDPSQFAEYVSPNDD